jgi:hypothetical protein
VQRDYRVNFADKAIGADAGVWLQGCNEQTHGVSFPLLSRPVKSVGFISECELIGGS